MWAFKASCYMKVMLRSFAWVPSTGEVGAPCSMTCAFHISVCIASDFSSLWFIPGGQLEKLMDDLHTELSSNPPLPGSYTARKGDLCAALFVDNSW